VLDHFRQAELVRIADAGHWVQHDKPAETIEALRKFLAVSVRGEAALSGPSPAA
jgi:pimeloyl-ACP methyl ester carboxylesterase